jgi:hypothetical protein
MSLYNVGVRVIRMEEEREKKKEAKGIQRSEFLNQ